MKRYAIQFNDGKYLENIRTLDTCREIDWALEIDEAQKEQVIDILSSKKIFDYEFVLTFQM